MATALPDKAFPGVGPVSANLSRAGEKSITRRFLGDGVRIADKSLGIIRLDWRMAVMRQLDRAARMAWVHQSR
jgi:hypothetical protein